ncbi:MAG: signal peptidase I [Propionicimonas sp.]
MTEPARRFVAPPSQAEQSAAKRSSRARAVWSAIGSGLMGALLVLLIGIGAAAILVPAVTGSVALTVRSSSMEPSLPPGTLIVVRPTDLADILPGRVLTYQLKSGEPTLVTHRVTQRMLLADGSPVFITKGDANAQPDLDPVKPVQIRGTVWYAIPYLGWVANLLTGELRTIVVSVLVGGLLVYAVWMFISAGRDRLARKRTDPADQPDQDQPDPGGDRSGGPGPRRAA